MSAAERSVVARNLDVCLDLWLAAIRAGDYVQATELIQWRVVLRARLDGNKEQTHVA